MSSTGAEYIPNTEPVLARVRNYQQLEEVGEQEKEKDEGEGKQIHEQAEDNAGMVQVPAWSEAADRLDGADRCEDGWNEEQQAGAGPGKV